jgi:outer membrane protein insertion porin family
VTSASVSPKALQRGVALLLATTALLVQPAQAQTAAPVQEAQPQAAPEAPALANRVRPGVTRAVVINGTQRVEPDTVRSYVQLNPGDAYNADLIDAAIKRLYDTDLFSDVTIRISADGVLTVNVRENPVINRVVFEGNRALGEDKLGPEVRLAPRQIYTRNKVRADVGRILELYRRQGRYAAEVDPKIILLEQNRVDLVFEITEGERSRVRQINFIGNKVFDDGDLRGELATRQARWWRLFTSNDTYDPDRLAYDRELLRQFYLSEGYADFRVVSAVAELAPDRRDFVITMVLEEGQRYKFGKVDLESKIRDLKPELFTGLLIPKSGEYYNAKEIEKTIETLTETAGLFGYAFADIRPRIRRDKEKQIMDVTFQINEAPRVYVERINVNGNTRTRDEVIRREFRLAEGDAFNSFKVKRSKDRIQSLGFFQEKLEIEQKPGSTPDKVVLEVNVEEKATGELQVGAGFSSLERFIADVSVRQRNFMGKGQEVRIGFTLSSFRNEIDLGFTDPYFLGRNLAAGIDLFRRDLNNFRFGTSGDRQTTYEEVSTGFGLRAGFPITEFWSYGLRYQFANTNIGLGQDFYFDPITGDPLPREPQNCQASVFVCIDVGNKLTSALGHSLIYDSLNNRVRPSAGQRLVVSQDVSGLGGDVKYLRNRVDYDFYYPLDLGILGDRWVLRLGAEAGHIIGFGQDVRLSDRFFLGGPRIRGFQIRGIGPRDAVTRDAIGGNTYYLGGAELELPLGQAASELGLRASIFADIGSLWKVDTGEVSRLRTSTGAARFNTNCLVGNTPSPRIAVGAGVSWNSPFGPFRIDLGRALKSVRQAPTGCTLLDGTPFNEESGDETEFFQFNIGTQF